MWLCAECWVLGACEGESFALWVNGRGLEQAISLAFNPMLCCDCHLHPGKKMMSKMYCAYFFL